MRGAGGRSRRAALLAPLLVLEAASHPEYMLSSKYCRMRMLPGREVMGAKSVSDNSRQILVRRQLTGEEHTWLRSGGHYTPGEAMVLSLGADEGGFEAELRPHLQYSFEAELNAPTSPPLQQQPRRPQTHVFFPTRGTVRCDGSRYAFPGPKGMADAVEPVLSMPPHPVPCPGNVVIRAMFATWHGRVSIPRPVVLRATNCTVLPAPPPSPPSTPPLSESTCGSSAAPHAVPLPPSQRVPPFRVCQCRSGWYSARGDATDCRPWSGKCRGVIWTPTPGGRLRPGCQDWQQSGCAPDLQSSGEFEARAPTSTSDRKCRPISPPCTDSSHVEVAPPTATSDRICKSTHDAAPACDKVQAATVLGCNQNCAQCSAKYASILAVVAPKTADHPNGRSCSFQNGKTAVQLLIEACPSESRAGVPAPPPSLRPACNHMQAAAVLGCNQNCVRCREMMHSTLYDVVAPATANHPHGESCIFPNGKTALALLLEACPALTPQVIVPTPPSPPPPLPPPPPTSVTPLPGPNGCNSFSTMNSYMAPVDKLCCDEPHEDCTQGFPTTCNAGCAAVLNPLLHHCRAFLQKGGAVTAQILKTVTAAAAACPKPCADFNDFQAGLSVVTAVCCDGPEHECQAGVPLRCDDRDQCSAALLPFRNEPSLLLPCTVATGSKFYERL